MNVMHNEFDVWSSKALCKSLVYLNPDILISLFEKSLWPKMNPPIVDREFECRKEAFEPLSIV